MFLGDARMDSHGFSAKDTSKKQPASASLSDLDWSGQNKNADKWEQRISGFQGGQTSGKKGKKASVQMAAPALIWIKDILTLETVYKKETML